MSPRFFQPHRIAPIIATDSEKSDRSAPGHFSNTSTPEKLLAWIYAILDRKSEPSAEIKNRLIHVFELLKKSSLSTDSINQLNKRLQNEDTSAAKAVSEAHRKVNQLHSTLKPTPSIFAKSAAGLNTPSLLTQGIFKPRPPFGAVTRKKDYERDDAPRFG